MPNLQFYYPTFKFSDLVQDLIGLTGNSSKPIEPVRGPTGLKTPVVSLGTYESVLCTAEVFIWRLSIIVRLVIITFGWKVQSSLNIKMGGAGTPCAPLFLPYLTITLTQLP